MWDKSTSSLKCALACFVSMLKSISFVFKWKRVVSMLSPLSLKSYGGSHNYYNLLGLIYSYFNSLDSIYWYLFSICAKLEARDFIIIINVKHHTPTRIFIRSGPRRSSLFSETPWNLGDKSNTTWIWSGLLGWYSPKWGKYQVRPSPLISTFT